MKFFFIDKIAYIIYYCYCFCLYVSCLIISLFSRFHVNRRLISRNLYAITPCLRQMLSLWQTTYTKLSFINADNLLSHVGTFDLVEFIVSNHHEMHGTQFSCVCSMFTIKY